MAELTEDHAPSPVSIAQWRARRKPLASVNEEHGATIAGLAQGIKLETAPEDNGVS